MKSFHTYSADRQYCSGAVPGVANVAVRRLCALDCGTAHIPYSAAIRAPRCITLEHASRARQRAPHGASSGQEGAHRVA